jgi:SAM-dependent methyltransferase
MAKITFQIKNQKEDEPVSIECIEVRPWGLGSRRRQDFVIGSGANFGGQNNIILEIIYSVGEVQFFYTRNYLNFNENIDEPYWQERLEKFRAGESDACGFGEMLPETFIALKRDKFSYQDADDRPVTSASYQLEVSADVGAVIGQASPGMRTINVKLTELELEEGLRFMQELTQEIADAYHGKRPNPADLPEGASAWQFIRQLNQRAYDRLWDGYQEKYFSNPLLSEMFDEWSSSLPAGSHILDAGCGHGDPVITRLLEKGFQVTGTDLSSKMLARAQQQFPNIKFMNQMVSEIRNEADFDGGCSFSSLLYLDPIDLSHSLYRLFRAIKPGGLLFLYAYDLHPSWRGEPYRIDLGQWMWAWSHGIEDVTQALEEFGYFKVLRAENVTTDEEKVQRIANWRKSTMEQHEQLIKSVPSANIPEPDLSKVPTNLPYAYAIIAQRTA